MYIERPNSSTIPDKICDILLVSWNTKYGQ